VTPFITAGAGFLLAVLWFDLMFDIQVVPHRRGDVPREVLSSMSRYYARVTTAASPMNRLVAAAMVATVASVIIALARGDDPAWLFWVSLPLIAAPVALAGGRTVRNAVRLGAGRDPASRQSQLAKAILLDHLLCASSIATLLALQLIFG
jgi:hypothetical protein